MRRARSRTSISVIFVCCLCMLVAGMSLAQEGSAGGSTGDNGSSESSAQPQKTVVESDEGEGVTITLNEAPLRDFLSAISKQLGTDFVLQPAVKDVKVTVSLSGVSPQQALSAVLQAHGLVSEKMDDNIHLIKRRPPEEPPPEEPEEAAEKEDGKDEEEKEKKPEPLTTEVIKLDYRNADDVKATLEPLLSSRGQIQVVQRSGFSGWSFQQAGGGGGGGGGGGRGGGTFTAREKQTEEYSRSVLSQMLLISDTKKKIKEIKSVLDAIDTRPKQVLISSRIVEVNRKKLRDLGVDIANGEGQSLLNADLEGRASFLSSLANPSAFRSDSGASPTYPFNAGLSLMFEKINGSEFQVLLHALEEKADANTLSAPKLLAQNNQEATMLVGRRFPILSTQVSGTEVTQITSTLDYYENIGIQLNVIPQIQNGKYINLIIHPVVSNRQGTISARGSGGQALAEYPIIGTREAETQVLIEDNQTIVIGGLLTEEEETNVIGVPLLSDIPYLGAAFRRTTTNTVKQDLLLFLSAKIVSNPANPSESTVRNLGSPEQRDIMNAINKAEELREDGKSREALRLLNQIRLGGMQLSADAAEKLQTLREELRKEVQQKEQEKQQEEQQKEEETDGEKEDTTSSE